jgi:hypothetical protein
VLGEDLHLADGPSPIWWRAVCVGRCQTGGVDIESVIEALGSRFDADETAVIERVLRDHGGTVPDQQLISEAALALAIFRRTR